MKDTAVILASGPSLTVTDCVAVGLGNFFTIAVNCSFRMAPWTNIIYMGDMLAVKNYGAEARRCSPSAELWTATDQPGWHRAKCVNNEGLGRGGLIHGGGNSGYQAINLAYMLGARHIILLGFDMGLGEHGEKHWHADHPKGMVQAQPFKEWLVRFDKLAADLQAEGVKVTNCSRRTALECFPRDILENVLCHTPT